MIIYVHVKEIAVELSEKVAIVTGVRQGIGQACSSMLLSKGVIVYGVDKERCSENFIHREDVTGKYYFIQADISNELDVESIKETISLKYDKIDLLINNAAKQTTASFFETSVSDFRDVVCTNLVGTFACSSILGKMIRNGGYIVNMLSVHSDIVRKDRYAYDASKAGAKMLTQETALALYEYGINVIGVSYGACDTPMNASWINNPELREEVLERIPLRWIATPDEIANIVIHLLEDFGGQATGSIFTIDGGRSLLR